MVIKTLSMAYHLIFDLTNPSLTKPSWHGASIVSLYRSKRVLLLHTANNAPFFAEDSSPSVCERMSLSGSTYTFDCTQAARLNVIVTRKSSWLRRYKTSILLAHSGTCCSTCRENERTISLVVCSLQAQI